uniref:G domain-containing protein n=1 Tax=Electrophorus electricus TaxID=8005 RepID=A0A4W4EXK3_ELEEL
MVRVFVLELEDVLAIPWREVDWTEKTRDDLRKQLVSCELKLESLSRVKALLLGPVGSGKSSLVNSIRSTMYGRTVHLPIIGSAETAFTQKLTSYDIRAKKRGRPTALSLCDAMGVGEEGSKDLTLSDALAVVRGHVPEGYKVFGSAPITDVTSGYRAEPSLNDRVHCVLFVLDASKVESYPESLCSALRELRTAVSDLGVPQLILLTHVDQVCPIAKEDVKYVYSSRSLQEKVPALLLVGLPLSFVFPVKNYISQLSVECNADILLLSVVNSVLQAVDDALEDHFPETLGTGNKVKKCSFCGIDAA